MTSATHEDASMLWLKIFLVCFVLSVFGIGVWACFFYKVDAPEAPAAGGHGGMILPSDGEWAPHARIWPTA